MLADQIPGWMLSSSQAIGSVNCLPPYYRVCTQRSCPASTPAPSLVCNAFASVPAQTQALYVVHRRVDGFMKEQLMGRTMGSGRRLVVVASYMQTSRRSTRAYGV